MFKRVGLLMFWFQKLNSEIRNIGNFCMHDFVGKEKHTVLRMEPQATLITSVYPQDLGHFGDSP